MTHHAGALVVGGVLVLVAVLIVPLGAHAGGDRRRRLDAMDCGFELTLTEHH